MPARKPEECDLLIPGFFAKGDLEGFVALYEPTATIVPEPGKHITGTQGIRDANKALVAMKPKLTIEVVEVAQSGDLALLHSKWSLTATKPDGTPLKDSGKGAEVVRRQKDGTWRFVIDNSHGGE